MDSETKKPNLFSLIDKKFLQELQDNFAKVTGLASVTLDEKGFITEPSNFCEFCKTMRANEKSNEACQKCDLERRRIGFKRKKPFIYTCHAGLTIFVVPIVVNNQTIALMVGGQTIIKEPDENFYKGLAKDFDMDEKQYLKNVKKLKSSTDEKIEVAANLLSLVANSISNSAKQNYELKQMQKTAEEGMKRETFLKEIISEISSTLNYDEIRKTLVSKLGDAMGSDFNVLYVFNSETQKFNPVDEYSLYLTSDEIESPVGINIIEEYGWSNLTKSGELTDIFYSDIENLKKDYNLYGTKSEEFLNKYKIKSAFYMAIRHAGDLLGMLALNYTQKHKIITQDDANLIKAVANQAGTALYQAKLYSETQNYAERETLLRYIIEILRSSLNLTKVKQDITKAIGEAFNANRCYFRSYDKKKEKFLAVDVEYLSSDKISSLIGVEPNQEALKFFSDEVKKQSRGFYPIIVNKDFAKGTPLEAYFKLANIAADYAIPIIDRYDEITWLVLHYADKDPKLSEEDKKLLESIAYQIAGAFEQIKLYEKEKTTAEREALLRKISLTIRKSLNLEETFNVICSELNKITDANRVTITESVKNEKNHVIKGEFKTGKNIKSAIERPNKDRVKVFSYLTSYVFKENKPLVINNFAQTDFPDFIKEFYNDLDVKSLAVFPIKKFNDEWGLLTISHVDKYKIWNQTEIDFIEAIIEQVYTAIKQAKLYDETLLRAKRENLIRNITDKIRLSLNMDNTLMFICEETAKFLNVQRSSIIVFPDKSNYMNFQLKKEFKETETLPGYQKISDINKVAGYWGKKLLENKVYGIDNILESDAPDFFKNSYSKMGVKAIIGANIGEGNETWANLLLSEYTKDRHWSDEEKEFLKTVSQQIYIAINQAELQSKMRQQSEREKAILTNLPFMVWLKDKESRFLAVNEPFAKMCNTTVDELIGKNDYDFWPKELADGYVKDDKEVMEKKRTKFIEELIEGEGNRRWHETYKTPIYDDKGKVVGTTGFARDITEQKEAQEKIIKAAQREALLRKIIETIRSSFDIEEILSYICEETAKIFNVQRTAITMFPNMQDFGEFKLRKEYRQSSDIKTFHDMNIMPELARLWGESLIAKNEVLAFDNLSTAEVPDYFKNSYGSAGIKSMMGTAIRKGKDVWGTLVLSEYNSARNWSEDDKSLLKTIADQIYIAINQAELYENEKKSAERETLLRNIVETIRSSIDIEKTKQTIINTIGKALNADRCFIIDYDKETDKYLKIKDEYLSSPDILGFKGVEPEVAFPVFAKEIKKGKVLRIQKGKIFIDSDEQEFKVEKESLQNYELHSGYALPIYYKNEPLGILAVTYVKEKHNITGEEINLLHTISNQTAIALYQAKLYKETQAYAEREKLLRKIIETIRETLDINEIKETIVTEVGKALNADRVFIVEFDSETGAPKILDENSEYITPGTKSLVGYNFANSDVELLANAHRQNNTLIMHNFEDFIKKNDLQNTKTEKWLLETEIKSGLGMSMYYGDKIFGTLNLHYTKVEYPITNEYIDFFAIITQQAGIALYQASLYEKIRLQAEREKMSRNIIEILRSTMDKTVIKRLFVKNIAKFFNADRVLLSEYDSKTKTYLPIDANSEYSTSPDFKTLIGFDWSAPEVSEFIQPLLEKRELNIDDFDDYIRRNPKGQDFIDFFITYDIKSSYNFPIIYENELLGFFCLDYIGKPNILSNEDISRIRSICTQAGIALYHANLYMKAKDCEISKKSFISNFSEKIRYPVREIIDISTLLSQNEFERMIEAEYLNKILDSCNYLLAMTTEMDGA